MPMWILSSVLVISNVTCIYLCLASHMPVIRKVFWVGFILLLPFAGAVVYLLMGRASALLPPPARSWAPETPEDVAARPEPTALYATAQVRTPRDERTIR